jgi:glycerate-2-kinase
MGRATQLRACGGADPRRDAVAIYRAAVAAVDPQRLVAARLRRAGGELSIALNGGRVRRGVDRLWVAGAGKAAVAMARGVARIAPEVAGIVIAPPPRGEGRRRARIGRIRVLYGEHPIPARGSFSATRALEEALCSRPWDVTILLLLSGGASALLAAPARGISTRDKARLNRLLIGAGLGIDDLNAVRKHVSRVKGGGLLRLAAGREVLTLALSDVVGDDPATIGSGPSVADPTTFGDALAAIDRHGLGRSLPAAVRHRLRRGAARGGENGARRSSRLAEPEPTETVKPGDPLLRRARYAIVGSNETASRAAAREARRRGYAVVVRSAPLCGEARDAARELVAALPRGRSRARCVIAGGETVVSAHGARGRGGRCQELALAAVPLLAGSGWTLLVAGTDGVDGRTPAAGAMCDGSTLARSGPNAVERALSRHDSYGFFSRVGGLLVTGPSGTNVMDLAIALMPGA